MDTGQGAAVVTGASSGIGKTIAVTLANAGYHVYAGVRRESDGTAVAGATRGTITPLLIDVTDTSAVADAARAVAGAVGERGITALINNAGIGMTGPVEALPLDTFRRQFEVNVFGQIAVTQAFLPLLRRAGGRIVNTGSVGDRFSMPFGSPLAASKWAFAAVTESLRLELRPWGIHVILLEPASINSGAMDKVEADIQRVLEGMDTLQSARYAQPYQGMMRRLASLEHNGSSPQVVADAVLQALTSKHPRTRYLVGKDAHKLTLLARMPDRVFDRIRVRLLGLPRKFGGLRAADARLVATVERS